MKLLMIEDALAGPTTSASSQAAKQHLSNAGYQAVDSYNVSSHLSFGAAQYVLNRFASGHQTSVDILAQVINAFAVYARISKQLILAIPAYWMLNRPSDVISLMSPIVGTSGSLDSEFVRLLFLQTHRETDLFFTASGVQLAQSDPGHFHYRRVVFSSHLKSKVGNIPGVAKATGLRMTLNIDVAPIASKSHTHPSHSQTSRRSGTDQGQIAQVELLKL